MIEQSHGEPIDLADLSFRWHKAVIDCDIVRIQITNEDARFIFNAVSVVTIRLASEGGLLLMYVNTISLLFMYFRLILIQSQFQLK